MQETFGDRVRKARERRKFSQRDLARGAGVDHAWVSRLESGERSNISFAAAKRLAQTLQVSLDYLAGLTNHPHVPQEP